ncbi:fluoride efflux transporter CrcB [Salipaludibacillus daqingensis]|uniref:fluoride efflux transporter CrcB n=1 Tax=Salipaludibacillus daqingensis TaxID=3041001 RepID=UPI00247621E9|nr:fluoride efflux transporter CrcB [Salipaludibacillus daqingensis]
MNILLVALGGGSGAVCRYLLGVWFINHTKQWIIPTAMVYVNVLGSFGLGIFFGFIYQEIPYMADDLYEQALFLLFGLGFFGAFTTFSTFSVEASLLVQKKRWKRLSIYVALSILGSILAFLTGLFLGGV